jgi:oxygen-independent coproporphyrinogen-3 oxidase
MNRKGRWFCFKEIKCAKRISKRTIETIYFGGGTPSVLTSDEINFLIDSVYENYEVDENQKSLEANPDDLSGQRILELSKVKLTALA